MIGLWSVNKTVGCSDPSIKNSHSVKVCMIAVHSLMGVESRSSACINKREFAEIRFVLFAPQWDCNNAAPMPNFEASHIAKNGDLDMELGLKFVQ